MKKMIDIRDYTYDLPANRIADHPLKERDQSKLLIYKEQKIKHSVFSSLPDYLPQDSILFFNDTKVIPARLFFQKDTGAQIELFLLHAIEPSSHIQLAMQATATTTWKCTIGNLKRWNNEMILTKKTDNIELSAQLENRELGVVKLSWSPAQLSFAEVVHAFGVTPLPPYIKREADLVDRERYQTIYSHYDGAVAAPTAGLHFTEKVLADIKNKAIETDFLTLHVSAGTFQPVKTENATEHEMHSEQIIITRKNLENLLSDKFIIAVGTTSTRTLESLYWYGVKLMIDQNAEFVIKQFEPYELPSDYSKSEAIQAILKKMERENLESITGETAIYILPGYKFKVMKALITNFHQPGSTLMLLVAALVGENWKSIYNEALKNQYRFLSYGDSSLLFS